jgi:hypothetical protein
MLIKVHAIVKMGLIMIYIIIDVIVSVAIRNYGILILISVFVLMDIVGIILNVDNAQQVHSQPQIKTHACA